MTRSMTRTRFETRALRSLVSLVMLAAPAMAQEPIPYHGRLAVEGLPADGEFDFEFHLFDDPDPDRGRELGSAYAVSGLDVHQGRFSAALAFEPAPAPGNWLEVRVRPAGGLEDFVPLLPRQSLEIEPRLLEKATGCSVTGDLTVQGNLGLGGTAAMPFTMFGTFGEVRIPNEGQQIEITSPGEIRFNATSASARLHLRVAGGDRLTVTNQGRVGIGTANPTGSLDVQGAIKLNSTAGFFQASPAGADGCGNVCAVQDSAAGFNGNSGACVAGWDANGNSVGCGSFMATRCLCVGVN